MSEETYAIASSGVLKEITLPAFISSSDCFSDLRRYSFGISGLSCIPTDRRFVRMNCFSNAFTTELKERPNSSAVFCACCFMTGSICIWRDVVFMYKKYTLNVFRKTLTRQPVVENSSFICSEHLQSLSGILSGSEHKQDCRLPEPEDEKAAGQRQRHSIR